MKLLKNIRAFLTKEDGQTFTEYAMILFLIVLVVILALTPLGTTIATVVGNVVAGLGS